MQAKAKNQTLWVLLLALALILLCTGGLWLYVQGAGAETGVQEASVAELPGDNEISITWEKYDNYPPLAESADIEYWTEGYGLTRREKERLASLKEMYANGERPSGKAPAIPEKTGFAIVPLDPDSFAGVTEYYFLPNATLTDEQLLQLIGYGEERGKPFTADTLTEKNSVRGGETQVNRLFSAGESERRRILAQRIYKEGLRPQQQRGLTLPISGIADIPMDPGFSAGIRGFRFLPTRELTDEELLQTLYLDEASGYTYLDQAKLEEMNPAKDSAMARAVLEEFMDMPMASENYLLSYMQNEATGEIRLHAHFQTAEINGKRTNYFARMDLQTGWFIHLGRLDQDIRLTSGAVPQVLPKEMVGTDDRRFEETARTIVEKITGIKARSIRMTNITTCVSDDKALIFEPAQAVYVTLEDGSVFRVGIWLSNGMLESLSLRDTMGLPVL